MNHMENYIGHSLNAPFLLYMLLIMDIDPLALLSAWL